MDVNDSNTGLPDGYAGVCPLVDSQTIKQEGKPYYSTLPARNFYIMQKTKNINYIK